MARSFLLTSSLLEVSRSLTVTRTMGPDSAWNSASPAGSGDGVAWSGNQWTGTGLAGCAGYQSPLFRSAIMSPGQGLAHLGAQTVRDGSHGDHTRQCYVSSPPADVYSSGVSLEEGPSQWGQRF